MSRVIVTDDGATYEQQAAGTSNSGAGLTEVRKGTPYWVDLPDIQWGPYLLLDPEQAEPYVGDRWLLRHTHGKYVLTDTVNEIVGDL